MHPLAKTLLTVEGLWSFGSGLFLPIFAIFSERVGGDITDAGIAAALFLAVTSLLEYPAGYLIDRFGEKWFLVSDYIFEAAIFIGYIYVDDKYELFMLQILLGAANAFGDPSWESLYDRVSPKKGTGSYWARSHLFLGLATAVGILLGSFLAGTYGFDVVFLFGAMMSLVAAAVSVRYVRNRPRR